MKECRKHYSLRSAFLGAVTILASLIVVSSAFAQREVAQGRQGNLHNPRIFPPGSQPYGLTYGEWSVSWWQWAYGLPVPGHPLFDETGADCAAGQSGQVWFLGGVFNVSGSAIRDLCVVPSGKAIFFPVINVEWDNICPPGSYTVDELRGLAASFMDLTTDLSCEVDGLAVQDVGSYRFTAGPFAVTMPEGNIFQFFGCETPAGTYGPMLPDGIFMMLAPLPTGPHTIHFKGTIGPPVNFTLEITYHLTVAPAGRMAIVDNYGPPPEGSVPLAPASPKTSWGHLKTIYR